jgi:polysaccharide deacetylase family protein (PEP-CTERM system associated)
MRNALSIDLEDWFCVYNFNEVIGKEDWDKCELRVVESTQRLLEVMSKHNTHATFFVLGWVAERVPALIEEIEKLGHEIACHGYSHTVLTQMTPESFELDIQRALKVTKQAVQSEIIGYRAPSFTVTKRTMWAIDILARNEFRYDSSIFPISYHPDYGIPNADLSVFQHDSSLIEFPMTCVKLFGVRIPCSGGAPFRIFPYSISKTLLRRCNSEGRPGIFYLHPWEVDPGQPRVNLPWSKRFRHYYNLNKTLSRFDRLLADFEFTTIRRVLDL